jgi:hypothetical protein
MYKRHIKTVKLGRNDNNLTCIFLQGKPKAFGRQSRLAGKVDWVSFSPFTFMLKNSIIKTVNLK